jgi:hypothetical protein
LVPTQRVRYMGVTDLGRKVRHAVDY